MARVSRVRHAGQRSTILSSYSPISGARPGYHARPPVSSVRHAVPGGSAPVARLPPFSRAAGAGQAGTWRTQRRSLPPALTYRRPVCSACTGTRRFPRPASSFLPPHGRAPAPSNGPGRMQQVRHGQRGTDAAARRGRPEATLRRPAPPLRLPVTFRLRPQPGAGNCGQSRRGPWGTQAKRAWRAVPSEGPG
jgi:hypothetical protein